MTPAEQLKEKLVRLESQLLEAHPQLPILLREIHTTLKSDPEIVTILTEEEIGIIVSGLKRQTNTEIAVKAAKKTSTAKLKNVGLMDL